MNFSLTFPQHNIPLWFMVLSLFLPRICMAIAWFQHSMTQFIPPTLNIIPVVVALLIPRVLILFWIYQDQGLTFWFLIHLIALLIAFGGGSHRVYRRRRRVEYVG
ncbi:MAG: hypothetical protein M3R43_03060 [Acidobacteriota bacterium]|nr:hypothetical protein [Acidobacteriota bacterium]